METWKDSHSDTCEQEFNYRGEGRFHGNMFTRYPAIPFRMFSSGNLPTPKCYLSLEP